MNTIIGHDSLGVKILSVSDLELTVKVISLNDKYYERYLDLGKEYTLFKHKHACTDSMLLYEFTPNQMNRQVSQLLLYWFDGCGWSFELDS